MKALFLVFHGFSEHNGISKKIWAQVDAMRACGVDTTLCYTAFGPEGNQLRMVDGVVLQDYGRGLLPKITKRIAWGSLSDYIHREGITMVYMRANHNANPFLIRFLRGLRGMGVRTVMEIPTWPYEGEYEGTPLAFRSRLWVDRIFRRRMAGELYRIVTFSNEREILGVKTVNISNGVNFSAVPVKTSVSADPARLNLIGVAEIHRWHGFDRAIAGLGEYYRTPQPVEVVFHVVGYGFGGALEELKEQTAALGLEKYVVFHGQQSGPALDAIFERADMGIASLARHRSGITHIKTLKNREYASRGIPFVYSEIDSDFESMPYILKVPADETPLDIARVVEFSRTAPRDPGKIRESVAKTLSWQSQMQKVIDEVKR